MCCVRRGRGRRVRRGWRGCLTWRLMTTDALDEVVDSDVTGIVSLVLYNLFIRPPIQRGQARCSRVPVWQRAIRQPKVKQYETVRTHQNRKTGWPGWH